MFAETLLQTLALLGEGAWVHYNKIRGLRV